MTSISTPMVITPSNPLDQHRAINRLAIMVATLKHTLSKEYSAAWLAERLREKLHEGSLAFTCKAVQAADAGDEIADAALREVGAELMVQPCTAPGHLQIAAYAQRALSRPPHKRPRGRYTWHDHWCRDIAICLLIKIACAEYAVAPTRNRASRRSDSAPSGCSLVTAAFGLNHVTLDEGTVQQHIWQGLPGELTRNVPLDFSLAGVSR